MKLGLHPSKEGNRLGVRISIVCGPTLVLNLTIRNSDPIGPEWRNVCFEKILQVIQIFTPSTPACLPDEDYCLELRWVPKPGPGSLIHTWSPMARLASFLD